MPDDQPLSNAEGSLAAVNLGMTYRPAAGPVTIFEGLSFVVRPGERVALVGPSGAGKSTILHLLGGLDRPTSGRVLLGGRDLTALDERTLADLRNREIGFIWQAASLLPEFSAVENVMMPLLIRGVNPQVAGGKAWEKLREVGLEARGAHRAGELSGGEQQRVAVARALVGEPKFLLADEPTGSLDHGTGQKIVGLLGELHSRHQLTSLYVTHSESFASGCDRVLELDQGRVREIPPNGLARSIRK
jgi:lipoprotein-releasing system ATP-binding protein